MQKCYIIGLYKEQVYQSINHETLTNNTYLKSYVETYSTFTITDHLDEALPEEF